MTNQPVKVTFSSRSSVPLADNEKVSIWEPGRDSQLSVDGSNVRLNGKWKVSMLGNFLGSGILGYFLIRPLFMKDRAEVIPADHIERLVIHEKKNRQTFHLFQTRDDGLVEVHIFSSKEPQAVNAALVGLLPTDRVLYETK